MNKSMLIGLMTGIGVAAAGGVASYTLLDRSAADGMQAEASLEQGSALAVEPVEAPPAAPQAQPAAARPAPAAPAKAAAPAPVTAAAAPAKAPAPVQEECWDEEVTVQAAPRDDKAIAGTAAGALIGGALADRLGDDNDVVTAAGAAAGAFLGRKAQREFQENNTTTTIERRCAPVGTR
jgi:uncharacterized protein YcfJ